MKPTFVRYLVLVLLALFAISAYLTRHCIAVANTTIQGELQLTTEQMGWVLSAFSFGYFFCQVPAGWLGSRFGTRRTMSALSVLWSAFTVWSAASSTFIPLLISRAAFGTAQAGLLPLSAKVVRDWSPLARRGFGSATVAASMSIGGVVTMGLTAMLLERFGWRDVFRMYSLVGVVWAAAFYVLFRTRPAEHPWVNHGELDLIVGTRSSTLRAARDRVSESGRGRDNPGARRTAGTNEAERQLKMRDLVARVIRSRSMWALCSHAGFRAAGYGLFVTWFPAFLEKGYGVTRESAGLLTMSPLIGVVIGAAAGGLVVDAFLARTGSKWISRSGVAFAVLSLCALCTLAAAWTSSVYQLVAAIAVGAIFSGMGNAAYWAATMDLAGESTAVVMGIVNMAGTVGAFSTPAVLGYIIGGIERSGGDWNQVIYIFVAIYLAGALCALAINPNAALTPDEENLAT